MVTNEEIYEKYAGKTITAKRDIFEMMDAARADMRGKINRAMKLFVVTQGEYSEYHVEAIFSNEDDAQGFIDNAVNP